MSLIRAQVRLPFTTGVPDDIATNTWWFDDDNGDFAAAVAIISPILEDFYQAIDSFFSWVIDGLNATCAFYDMTTPEPRVPTIEQWTLTPDNANGTMPSEVALCLSYKGQLPDSPRRRGRVYLGPLSIPAGSAAVGDPSRPSAGLTTALSSAVTAFNTALSATVVDHVTFSPTSAEFSNVRQYWFNNEFDTQRRRGVDETVRTVINV